MSWSSPLDSLGVYSAPQIPSCYCSSSSRKRLSLAPADIKPPYTSNSGYVKWYTSCARLAVLSAQLRSRLLSLHRPKSAVKIAPVTICPEGDLNKQVSAKSFSVLSSFRAAKQIISAPSLPKKNLRPYETVCPHIKQFHGRMWYHPTRVAEQWRSTVRCNVAALYM